MPGRKVEVVCFYCKDVFIRELWSVVRSLRHTGFWSCKTCCLKNRNHKSSRPNFSIRINKKRQRQQIKVYGRWLDLHRYIVEKYLCRPLEKDEIVHHLDGDKSNNKISNLDIMLHGKHTTLHHTGAKRPPKTGERISRTKRFKSILTEKDVISIRSEYIPFQITMKMLAEKYSVSKSIIQRIIENKTWREVA